MQLRPLARAVLVTSGRGVAVRAVPLACAVALGAVIVFAPQGMRAHDLVAIMASNTGARVALWAGWIALATPTVAPAFDAPGTRTLRALRPPRSLFLMLVALLAAAQLPWVVLFARGGGALSGASNALLSVATSASACAIRSRRGLALFAASSFVVVLVRQPLVAIVPAAVLAWTATQTAWREALVAHPTIRIVRRAPPAIALAAAYVARMARNASARLQASAVIMFAAGGALTLTLRNDPDARPFQRMLVVLALPISVTCGLLAAPAIETEARLVAVLRQARATALTLFFAVALALAAPCSAFAATAGVVATVGAHAPRALPLVAVAWALPIAAVIAAWARRATRARRSTTFILGVLAIAVVFTLVPAAC